MAAVNNYSNSNSPPPYSTIENEKINGVYNQNESQNQQQMPMPTPMPVPIVAAAKNINTIEMTNTYTAPNPSNNQNDWGNMNGLSEKKIRIGFIRKVYLIVTSQLIFTFGIVSIFVFVPSIKEFAKSSAGLAVYIVSYAIFVSLVLLFSCLQCCKPSFLRKTPWNYILLFCITCSLTYMLAMISAYHQIEAVFIAIGITLLITIGVTLFAMQTKFDFTNCWLVAICLSLALMGFGIACAICYNRLPILQAVYGGLGALLMALFLAIDTQMLVGNKKYSYGPEDYVNAALQLYLDIAMMFLYILQAVGGGKR